MNIKTKAIVEDLLILINQMQAEMQPRGLGQHLIGRIEKLTKQGQNLINPSPKFLWERHYDGSYHAFIGRTCYVIKPQPQGWTIYINESNYSTRKTLLEAKQACVDYGVANYKKPEA